MKKYRVFILLIIITLIYLTVNVNSAFVINEKELVIKAYKNNELVRFHVIANSNSPRDQYLKRLLRDEILLKINSCYNKKMMEDEIINMVKEYAGEILRRENACYSAVVKMGDYLFPRRSYGNITLPAGNYRALRIILGSGKGSNWWCVLFPPLCIQGQEIASGNYVKENNIKLKFKVLELFKDIDYKFVEFDIKSRLPQKGSFIKIFDKRMETG